MSNNIEKQNFKKHCIIVISGPSGAGKSSIVEDLLNNNNLNLYYSVSCTSRPIRDGEVNGKEYYFLSKEEFQKKINNNQFIEYTEYLGNYYGTLNSEVFNKINEKNVLLEIEYKGLVNLKKLFDDKFKIVSIGVLPIHEEDVELLEKVIDNRLKKRNLDKPEPIKERISYILKTEIKKYNKKLYNYIVYNKDNSLAETISQVRQIIKNNIEE